MAEAEKDSIDPRVREFVEKRTRELWEASSTIRKQQAYLDGILQSMADVLVVVAPGGAIRLVNRAAVDLLGFAAEELLGQSLATLVAPEDQDQALALLERVASDGVLRDARLTLRPKSSQPIPVLINAALLGDGRTGGDARETIVVARDMRAALRAIEEASAAAAAREKASELAAAYSRLNAAHQELRSTQEKLIQSSKMAAVGTLAAGVAHEVNNPLCVILGFGQGIERRLSKDDPSHSAAAAIVREAKRCQVLIEDLLSLARIDSRTRDNIDLNEVVRSSMRLLQSGAGLGSVQLVHHADPALPLVRANRRQIQQVLVNLATNSLYAMAGAGTLTFRTGQGEGEAWVEVIDVGTGIPADIRARIFEPFFSTKPTGQGTGLGLSVVYEIVHQHGGTIEVESEPGKGTTMRVRLPRSTPEKGL